LAILRDDVFYVGLDISPAMVKVAREKSRGMSQIWSIQADAFHMPFRDESTDIVLNRLAVCSLSDTYRVFKRGGAFFQFGFGPESEKEILNLSPDRYEKDAFFIPNKRQEWRSQVVNEKRRLGFSVVGLDDYRGLP